MRTVLRDLASQPWPPWLSRTSPVGGSYPSRRNAHGNHRQRLSARRGILLIGIYLTLDAEAGFEPARTLWALRAYETRELDLATLLRDNWQVVPVLPRTHFVLEAKLHKLVPHLKTGASSGIAAGTPRYECGLGAYMRRNSGATGWCRPSDLFRVKKVLCC